MSRHLARPLRSAAAVFCGNPFDVDARARRRAADALDQADIPAALTELLRTGDTATAKTLILAVGHCQACDPARAPSEILGPDVLPRSVQRQLPRNRTEYLALVLAAGRCYRALERLRGTSELLGRTRRATWAACFGDSLLHALELEQVIRDHDILILGETGTGKEIVAGAIQEATPGRPPGKAAPSAAINAAAIPDSLVESELFGHVRGAFTGATDNRPGRLKSAHGGSFFLDEVGDLPSTTQVKLLRVMETNEVYPVGADSPQRVEVRYITATHKDLSAMVEAGQFRRDLYERMAGSVLSVPPLRDRPEDIVEIGSQFVACHLPTSREQEATRIRSWLSSAEARTHSWPGNVRELQNVLRNLMLGLDAGLDHSAVAVPEGAELPVAIASGSAALDAVTDWYCRRVWTQSSKNYSRAARALGVDRSTLKRRLDGN